MSRYFTIEEANELLPEIRKLMGPLVERQAQLSLKQPELQRLLRDRHNNVGGREASDLLQDLIAIETLSDQIRAFGCDLKDIHTGLVDFPARIDGREVFLCWRFDEDEIVAYHDVDGGFNDRRYLSD